MAVGNASGAATRTDNDPVACVLAGSPGTRTAGEGIPSARPFFVEVSAVINLYYPLVIVLYVVPALWQSNLGHF